MKDAIELTHEITKLIKYSPWRENSFKKVKVSITVLQVVVLGFEVCVQHVGL